MDRRAIRQEHGHQLVGRLGLGRAQLLEPGLAPLRAVVGAARGGVVHGLQDRPRIADQSQRDVAVLADRAVVHVDLHHRGLGAQALAIAHAEVEGGADNDDHVGLVEGVTPGAVEVMGIARRQQAAARAVEIGRQVEPAHQRDRRLVAARHPHLGPEQDARPLRRDQEIGQFLHVRRVADRLGRGAVAPGLGQARGLDRDLAVEHVAWDLQVDRPRRAGKGLARGHGDHVGDPLRAAYSGRELGNGRHNVDVGQVLQRAHLVLVQRALAADVQDRALRAQRGGDAGDRVGAAGTGRGHHATELAGLAGVAVGGVRGDLLVAHVDDADAFVQAAIVDVDDMAAAQREDGVDAFVPQGLGDQVAARDDRARPALLRQRIGCRSYVQFRSPGPGAARGSLPLSYK